MRPSRLGLEDLDAAAARVDELRDHGKADSGASDMAALRGLALVKGLENSIALFGRDAGPAVDHIQYQLLAFGAGLNRYRAAARGELDGIRQQVVENEAHLSPIGAGCEVLDLDVRTDALRHQGQLLVFEHRFDQWTQSELRNFETDTLGLPCAE